MLSLRRSLLPILILVLGLLILGTVGYYFIEGWTFLESFYMTAISLTTVGYGEVRPLSQTGQLFTILILFLGVGAVALGAGTLGEYILKRDFAPGFQKRRVRRMIEKMSGHVVVCGYGRVGKSAVDSLLETDLKIVVVDKNPKTVSEMYEQELLVVEGDATIDETLLKAGIDRAAGLIACSGKDAENLFIVLSARTLNPDLTIIARTVDAANESKMRRAGANRVISPYGLGGRFMANMLIRPRVTEFLDVVTLDSGLELWLEEFLIDSDSWLSGKTVYEAELRRKTGVTLVALLRDSGDTTLTPDENTRLIAGDELIVLGTRDQLASLDVFEGKQT